MLAKSPEEIPLWSDFSEFLACLVGRFFYYFSSFFSLLIDSYRFLRNFLFVVKQRGVSLLMRRKHRWFVERLDLTSLAGTVLVLVLFVPSVQTLAFQGQVRKKLASEEYLVWGSQDVLVQNNVAVTDTEVGGQRAEIIEYTVKSGDTLFDIGKRFNVTVESLAYINNLANQNLLTPGDTIKVPPVTGVIHKVKEGETVSSIAQQWNVSPQSIVDSNWLDDPYILAVGQELIVPGANIPSRSTTAALASLPQLATGKSSGLQLLPVGPSSTGRIGLPSTGRITQYFSFYHPAIDIAARCGAPIVAADSGRIYFANWWAGGGGYTVMIDHGNGYITKYAHLGGFAKRSGGVAKGEVIGYMGATGRAYGCHVHFVVEFNGRAVNPLSL